MGSRQLLFRTFYRLGFTPWDGHPLPASLANLIEGENAPTPAKAAAKGVDVRFEQADVTQLCAQRFEGPWTLLSSGSEPAMDHDGKDAGRFYLLARAS